MTYPSYLADYGETLVANGYHVIPIMPGSKVPGRYTAGEWLPYLDWSRHCDRPTQSLEIDIWHRWPACGVGIACGMVVGLDIDIRDGELAIQLADLATAILGETPCIRIGQSPKRLLVYRTDTPFAGRKRHPLEVLARGQQFVAYAVHPGTGRPYDWPEDNPLDVPLDKLPAVTESQVMAWLDQAYALIPAEMKPRTLIGDSVPADVWRGPSDPRGTYEAIRSALAHIPNDDLDGTSWITMGAAIKAALGEDGRDLWLDWSRQSSKSGASGHADTPERRWATLRPHSIGAGSIYAMAAERGWVPPAETVLNGDAADRATQPHPAAGLLARLALSATRSAEPGVTPSTRQVEPVPEALLDVDGLLLDLLTACNRTAIRPQPFLALGAAICAIGVLAGRRYRTATNLRTNIYAAAIADSGGGKDHAAECIREALTDAGLDRYLGGEGLASGAGLLASLQQHPARLFLVDEMGLFLSGVTGRRVPPHKAEIWTELLRLYSRAKGTYRGTEYADPSKRARVDLQQPHACFYGTTTPSTFWSALEGGAMADGSLARFLVFITDQNYPARNRGPGLWQTSAALANGLRAVAAGAAGHDHGGNLADAMQASVQIVPFTVPMTADATREHDERLDTQDLWAKQVEGTPKAAIVNRVGENAAKLALVRAVGRDPAAPAIGVVDIIWAWALSEHCASTLLREADRFLSDNEAEAKHKKALNIIRAAGAAGITRTKLMERTHFLGERRDAVFHALIESGQVEMDRLEGRTKPTIIYRSIPVPNVVISPEIGCPEIVSN